MTLMVNFMVNFVISYEGCSSQSHFADSRLDPASTRNFTQTEKFLTIMQKALICIVSIFIRERNGLQNNGNNRMGSSLLPGMAFANAMWMNDIMFCSAAKQDSLVYRKNSTEAMLTS